MVLDLLGALQGRVWHPLDNINIDSVVCKFHYRVTFLILLIFSLIVTGRQYIGDPIDCMVTSSAVDTRIVDQYCWISTTFSLPSAFDKVVGQDVPHPGIDKSSKDEDRVYHQYYQWVCFVLFLQAMMFYMPHYIWKIWEGGRIKALASGLMARDVIAYNEDTRQEKRKMIIKYFQENMHEHNFYYIRFMICLIANFINVVGQIYFTNRFLGGQFVTYGTEVVKYSETDQQNRTDPMIRVFPRITKCIFHTFGSSGDVQRHDALCVLPINIINEKIYIFLWFLFILLAVITGLDFLYRLIHTISPQLRLVGLRMHSRFTSSNYIDIIIHKFQIGDWFVLCQLGKVVDSKLFSEMVLDLAKHLEGKEGNSIV